MPYPEYDVIIYKYDIANKKYIISKCIKIGLKSKIIAYLLSLVFDATLEGIDEGTPNIIKVQKRYELFESEEN